MWAKLRSPNRSSRVLLSASVAESHPRALHLPPSRVLFIHTSICTSVHKTLHVSLEILASEPCATDVDVERLRPSHTLTCMSVHMSRRGTAPVSIHMSVERSTQGTRVDWGAESVGLCLGHGRFPTKAQRVRPAIMRTTAAAAAAGMTTTNDCGL